MEYLLAELDIALNDDFRGKGYGVPDPATPAAIELPATTEVLLFDLVGTGTAMDGLIDSIRRDHYTSEQSIVFLRATHDRVRPLSGRRSHGCRPDSHRHRS
jgi:1-aminocyclopropane-1-carboxylate deaminase/D-cysteine desulfhydrase-like pyridoxal-dependent ACC family enzyme